MKRTHLLSAAAFGLALAAAGPVPAQQRPDGADGGPAELLRRAQSAMRAGQAAQAAELLERAETRLLTGVEHTAPAGGEPAFHASEARRALVNRDRAEAMRHTNMAIATVRGGGAFAGGDGGGGGDRRGVQGGGGPGAVDSGMGTLPIAGRAVVRDGGTAGTSVSRAEGIVLAQSGTGAGGRGAPTGLPPGDTLPGWSGPGAGTAGPRSAVPTPVAPSFGGPSPGGPAFGPQGLTSGPSSSSMIGGEPARIGGAPPGDTTRSPGSSGIGGAGVGGPLR